ncbi:KxYKxGKxW signal peptide domain-containing protein [Levilactobacillus spicheri]|uniref:KxYKxGKxW signal peptide domain-containing protein n=2 Tax=Levilactobacillus spicheri TaxID=216463 RepID=UPI001F3F0EC4|nr:KxYKxGKxW signal peptide domain-containing protein [Levilactobacillus spicheri]
MKGLTPKKSELAKANSRTHFKMYKAGIHWVIAGISTVGGLFGMGTIGTTIAAKADAPAGIAQEADPQQVAATQTSGEIPATSTSVSESSLAEESDSGKSTSEQVSETSESESRLSASSETIDSEDKVVAEKFSKYDQPLLVKSGENGQTLQNQQLEKNKETPVSGQTVVAQTRSMKNRSIGSTPNVYQSLNDYQNGIKDAQQDLTKIINKCYDSGKNLVGGAIVQAGKHALSKIPNIGLIGSNIKRIPNTSSIGSNIKKISDLMDNYYQDDSLQIDQADGKPIWHDKQYDNHPSKQGLQLKDYNQGYADYIRSFAQGIANWITSIKSKATNTQTANSLIDGATYNANSMTGVTPGGEVGLGVAWLIGSNANYSNEVLGYQPDGSPASVTVALGVKTINDYIKLIAPNIIDGIAHKAMSDIRSLGGSIQDQDYAPATLSEATKLNGNITTMVHNLGLDDVLTSSLLQKVYEGIRANAMTALENNWTQGENEALVSLLGAGTYRPQDYSKSLKAINDPGAAFDEGGGKLSVMAHDAGKNWALKVFGPLINMANEDAWQGSSKKLSDIVEQLRQQKEISNDEANQLIMDKGAIHFFNGKSSGITYQRNALGVQEMLELVYQQEYRNAWDVVNDIHNLPLLTPQRVQNISEGLSFKSPITENLQVTPTEIHMGIYQKIWQDVWSYDPGYMGMLMADWDAHNVVEGNSSVSSQDAYHSWVKEETAWIAYGFAIGEPENISDLIFGVYHDAYQQESIKTKAAFEAGVALARLNAQKSGNGTVVSVKNAGSYQQFNAVSDGTGTDFSSFSDGEVAKMMKFTEAPHPGQAFTDGYQSQLQQVQVVMQSASHKDQVAFQKTNMAINSGETVNVLKDKRLELTAPILQSGWHTVGKGQWSMNGKVPTVTFQFASDISFVKGNLSVPTGEYDGRSVKEHLTTGQLTLQWADHRVNSPISIPAQWLEVSPDDSRVGRYTVHLSQTGVQQVLQKIKHDSAYEQPSAKDLSAIVGDFIMKDSTTRVPIIQTWQPQVIVGQSLQTKDFVLSATDALGHRLSSDLVTSNLSQTAMGQPGSYPVTLTLVDPTSGETVHKTVQVTVISQDTAKQIADSEANLNKDLVKSMTTQFNLESQNVAQNDEQSLTALGNDLSSLSTWIKETASTNDLFASEASISDWTDSEDSVSTSILKAEEAFSSESEVLENADNQAFTSLGIVLATDLAVASQPHKPSGPATGVIDGNQGQLKPVQPTTPNQPTTTHQSQTTGGVGDTGQSRPAADIHGHQGAHVAPVAPAQTGNQYPATTGPNAQQKPQPAPTTKPVPTPSGSSTTAIKKPIDQGNPSVATTTTKPAGQPHLTIDTTDNHQPRPSGQPAPQPSRPTLPVKTPTDQGKQPAPTADLHDHQGAHGTPVAPAQTGNQHPATTGPNAQQKPQPAPTTKPTPRKTACANG